MKPLFYVPVVLVVHGDDENNAALVAIDIMDKVTSLITALDGWTWPANLAVSPASTTWIEKDACLVEVANGLAVMEQP